MNQETLAKELGLTFQQVQKYEGGANRVSASRLAEIAEVLGVGIEYFFAGLQDSEAAATPEELAGRELMQRAESLDLVRAYYAIPDPHVRRQFFELVSAVAQSSKPPE